MTRLKNLAAKLGALVTGLALVLSAQAQTVTYFHNDMAGTPMVATDASGTVVWKESYRRMGSGCIGKQPALPTRSGLPESLKTPIRA